MNFIDEFAAKMGFEKKLLTGGFKIICFSFDSILIEGHKGIMLFSDDEMRFKIKGGSVSIVGEKLSLKNFSKHSVVVCGKIKKTEFM